MVKGVSGTKKGLEIRRGQAKQIKLWTVSPLGPQPVAQSFYLQSGPDSLPE